MLRQTKTPIGSSCVRDLQPTSKAAQTRAQFLHKVLWADPMDMLELPTVLQGLSMAPPAPREMREPCAETEVRAAVLRQQNGKSMRPTGIPSEAWKGLVDIPFLSHFTHLLAKCIVHEEAPSEFEFEEIFALFKSKDPSLNSYYRWLGLCPISRRSFCAARCACSSALMQWWLPLPRGKRHVTLECLAKSPLAMGLRGRRG